MVWSRICMRVTWNSTTHSLKPCTLKWKKVLRVESISLSYPGETLYYTHPLSTTQGANCQTLSRLPLSKSPLKYTRPSSMLKNVLHDLLSIILYTPTSHRHKHTTYHPSIILHLCMADLTQEQTHLLQRLKSQIHSPHTYKQLPVQVTLPPPTTMWEFNALRDIEYDTDHDTVRKQLMEYRKKADKVYKIDQLLKSFQTKFNQLLTDRDTLLKTLDAVKGETALIASKQKAMLDLSLAIKQTLNYYQYFDKFQFNWPCEITNRELFQGSLQSKLAQLQDGIEFTNENIKYVGAKRLQKQFQSAKSKLISFTRSFLVKLFNSQNAFTLRFSKSTPLPTLQSLYPKPRIRLVTAFLTHFPHFKPLLRSIIHCCKQGTDPQPLDDRQMQIDQFLLTQPTLSLISHLQQTLYPSYEQAILHLLSYHRTTIHQQAIKPPQLKDKCHYMCYMLASQYAYLLHCTRASTPHALEYIQHTLTTISHTYRQDIRKHIKKEKNFFSLCDTLSQTPNEFKRFMQQHTLQEYKGHVFGQIRHLIKDYTFLHNLVLTLCKDIVKELQSPCVNTLPKISISNRAQATQAVTLLISYIPRLNHCGTQAQRYLLSSLQTIVKAIKDINTHIQSRFQCYVWNIEIFGTLRDTLRDTNLKLIRKEYQVTNILQSLKHIPQREGVLQYAQDLFSALTTAAPIINELTLDYTEYINTQYLDLQTQFVKDILFVYSKGMIEFLQKMTENEDNSALCSGTKVQNVYAAHVYNLEKYVGDAMNILTLREGFNMGKNGEQTLKTLLDDVYERMFDLLDIFYKETAKYTKGTNNMEEICLLKAKHKNTWKV